MREKTEGQKKCNACACVYNANDMRVKLFSFGFFVDGHMNTHTEQQHQCEKKYREREKHTHTHERIVQVSGEKEKERRE